MLSLYPERFTCVMTKELKFILAALALIFTSAYASLQELVVVRMGVYNNSPLEYLDENGMANGFVIDLLEAVARSENWQVEYVFCEWTNCLRLLENGEIDLMGAIAYSDERSQRFDFNQISYFTNWGIVYKQPENGIESILDLDGKNIALVEDDIYSQGIQEKLGTFGIEASYTYVADYEQVFVAIDEGLEYCSDKIDGRVRQKR